jgi:hypothetical protein
MKASGSIFPVQADCANPNCKEPFDSAKAEAQVHKSGLVYVECDESIIQGYIRIRKLERSSPLPSVHSLAFFIKRSGGMPPYSEKSEWLMLWNRRPALTAVIGKAPSTKSLASTSIFCCVIKRTYRSSVPLNWTTALTNQRAGIKEMNFCREFVKRPVFRWFKSRPCQAM